MAFRVRVLAFNEGENIPRRHTCEGDNVSPAVEWLDAPPPVKSYALIMDDPDAPAGIWNHWLLWDIPASQQGLAEGFTAGRFGTSGANDFGKPGYGGPCPPKGHGPHRYFFKVYALGTARLGLNAGANRAQLDKAMRGHIVAEAWAMGKYERR